MNIREAIICGRERNHSIRRATWHADQHVAVTCEFMNLRTADQVADDWVLDTQYTAMGWWVVPCVSVPDQLAQDIKVLQCWRDTMQGSNDRAVCERVIARLKEISDIIHLDKVD